MTMAQRKSLRAISNSSVKDVIRDADKILKLVMMDASPIDTHKPHKLRATDASQMPKQQSGERRRRSGSPQETKDALKKSKRTLEDDGSRDLDYDDDDDDAAADCDGVYINHTRSDRSGRPALDSTRRVDAPKVILPGAGRRAPLAEAEDSTVTPEVEHGVGRKMLLLKCNSLVAEDDTPDGGLIVADGSFDDVDGDPDDEEPRDENEKIIAEIAMKLRTIGDDENNKFDLGKMTKSASVVSLTVMAMGLEGIQDLLSNLTYEQFQDVVNRNMGNEPGVQQVTVMFRLARAAARKLGNETKAADLKRITLDYFRRNVATWVSQNGGWAGIAELL